MFSSFLELKKEEKTQLPKVTYFLSSYNAFGWFTWRYRPIIWDYFLTSFKLYSLELENPFGSFLTLLTAGLLLNQLTWSTRYATFTKNAVKSFREGDVDTYISVIFAVSSEKRVMHEEFKENNFNADASKKIRSSGQNWCRTVQFPTPLRF